MVTSRSTFPRGAPRHCDSLHHGRGPINYRPMTKPTTLGELKHTEWASPARIHRTVKDELRENLICLLENGSPLFPGIVGYEDSVIPQLVNAVLSRHNFILLGLRGQAKSRILRQLVTLLDEEIPILAGSENRYFFVEQRDELAQDAALRLSPQAQQDEIVAGQDGVHELRDDGVLVADDPREQR